MKKKLLFLLILLLFCTACGEEKPEIKEILVMTEGDAECWTDIKIENVKIVVEKVPEGTMATRVLTAKNKPNIVCLEAKEDMEELKEYLLDIEDEELDGYDRAKFANDDYEEIEAWHATSEGEHYVFPNYTVSRENVEVAWLYRADVFNKCGIAIPETMKDLADACAKLKKQYKDSYPLVFKGGYQGLDMIAPAWKKDAATRAYYDFEEEEWCYGYTEPWAGNFVSFWASMAKNGLIPKNYLAISDGEIDGLIAEENVFIMADYVSEIERMKEKYPEQDWRIMPPPRANIETGQHKIAKLPSDFSGVAVYSGDAAEEELALMVIDQYFMNSYQKKPKISNNARLAEIYTEDKVNPARYTYVPEGDEEMQLRVHMQGVLPAFLTGEIPMNRWAKYAEQFFEKGLKTVLADNKTAYNSVQK